MTDREPDAKTIETSDGPPPDEGLAYDPEMTDADEANIPPASNAHPDGAPDEDEEGGPGEGGD
jgi:hypothetical protein